MGYTLNQNFELEQFEEWAHGMGFFALCGNVQWADDDNDESPVDWDAIAVCQSQDLAFLLSERYDDERDQMGKAGGRYEFELPFFLNKMRSDWCYAIFDACQEGDKWFPKSDLPVAIVLTSRDASLVAQQIEEQGGTAIVEGCHPYPHADRM